jgi:succinoglycan biosynthesis transport protein ExoP
MRPRATIVGPGECRLPTNGRNTAAEWLEPPAEEAEGLRRYVETIRERIWLVGLTILATTLIAILYVLIASKTYEATANLLVTSISTDDAAVRSLPLIFETSDPTRDVETASQFVNNTDVAATVKQRLSLDGSPRDVLQKITVQPVAQSNIVAVTAKGGSPEDARDLANAFAQAAVDDRTTQVHDAIDAQLPQIQAQLQGATNPAVAGTLGSELAQFQTLRNAQDPSFRVETLADLPQDPASPRPALSLAAGLLGGVILGVAAAFVAQALDPRVRRESQLRRQYRLPILARVPRETGRTTKALGPRQLSAAGAEAYRMLRATLESTSSNGRGGRVVLVTGSSPSEGKSTTAVNLASSLALAGNRVILIEADLRRPALATALGTEPKNGGVVGVLIERASVDDALTPIPGYGPNLRALLADYEGGWITELFTIPAAGHMIDEARRMADYVVIDSPPLNEVVDALPLARKADDVLIVVRLGRTRLEKVAQLGELLAESGVRPAGFAVVGVPRPGRGGYRYYNRGSSTSSEQPERALFKSPAG